MRGAGTVHLRPPGSSDDAPGIPTTHLDDLASHGPRSALVMKPFLPRVAPGWTFAIWPWSGLGRDGDLGPML
jgi:hypothetical protein